MMNQNEIHSPSICLRYRNNNSYTPSGEYNIRIDFFLDHQLRGSTILELGSGLNEDSDYFEMRGYRVDRYVTEQTLVEYNRNLGYDCELLHIQDTHLEQGKHYSLIFSNGMVGNLEPTQLSNFVDRLFSILNPNGKIALSFQSEYNESKDSLYKWNKDSLYHFFLHKNFYVEYLEYADNKNRLFLVAKKLKS